MRIDGRPILDSRADARLFVERSHEVQKIADAVDLGLNTLVAGPRGSGRTSLLRYLQHTFRELDRDVTYLDASRKDANQIMVLLRERVAGPSIKREGGALQGPAGLARVLGLPTESWSDHGGLLREIDTLDDHFRDVADLAASVGDPEPDRAIILLDGPPAGSAHTLFGRLRDEIWNLPVQWIVAIDLDAWPAVLREPADAFFEARVVLEPFGPAAAKDLLLRRVPQTRVSDVLLDEIVAQAAGDPRQLISLTRDVVVDGKNGLRAHQDREARRRKALAVLSPSARQLAEAITARGGSVSASDESIRTELGWTRGRVSQVFQELSAAGLVVSAADTSGQPGRPRKLYSLVLDDPHA
jgi:hypothetical protein